MYLDVWRTSIETEENYCQTRSGFSRRERGERFQYSRDKPSLLQDHAIRQNGLIFLLENLIRALRIATVHVIIIIIRVCVEFDSK